MFDVGVGGQLRFEFFDFRAHYILTVVKNLADAIFDAVADATLLSF